MPSVPVHYVDLRAFCYATEDEKRVEAALRTYLPEEFPIERAGEAYDKLDSSPESTLGVVLTYE